MSTTIYLYIILAILFSLLIAFYQYFYKNKGKTTLKSILFFLRFLSVFLILLLLINPKITKSKIETIKPSLIVLTDNSKSIIGLKQEAAVKELINKIKSNTSLNNKFALDYYTFSDDVSFTDSLTFNKNKTNISKTLQSVNEMYKKSIAPIIMITDGNQTLGTSYTSIKLNQTVFPLVVGDTTTHQDVYLSQLNVNKYAYLKNKFPVEVFVNYKGQKAINTKLTIKEGQATVFSKMIALDAENNSQIINFFIPANSIGFHNYKAKLSPIKNEKNNINNKKNFIVEVLNEQSKILIISDILHPDVAMLKRAIESNKQRKVVVVNTKDTFKIADYQLVILYQPTISFKSVFTDLETKNKNFFIITGTNTNWNFLNLTQKYFSKKAINTKENYLAVYNASYNTFATKNIGFDDFQPITDYFGKVSFSVPYQSILFQQIGSINSEEPLLATFEQNGRRGAVLLGENSWRWRMTSKIESNSFQPFDEFINKTIQYLASNKKSSFLDVYSNAAYYLNEDVKITAKFYDANYVFNPLAKLNISIVNKQSRKQIKYPFALENENFVVNISNLPSGNYSYSVFDSLNKNKAYGNFTILDYNIEQQFSNSNKKDLELLAKNTNGNVHYPNSIDRLVTNLVGDDKFISIQKSKKTITPLIDWKWLLGIIALLLSTEWFLRKYKGYI